MTPTRRRLLRFLRIAPLALVAALIGVLLYGRPSGKQPPPSPWLGRPVPEFALPGYDAQHPGLASADLRQGSVTVINVFASWCLPCRVEAPQLARLSRSRAVVHGIAVHDSRAGLSAFFRNYGNPFRRIGMDDRSRVSGALRVSGLPETFVVDGRGVVRWHHRGDLKTADADAVLAAVARAR